MSDRLHVATRKGLFIFERAAKTWKVANTAFLGVPVSVVLPDRRDGSIFAAVDHGHFGAKLHRSTDGGKNWNLGSFVGDEPEGRGYSIMPASLRLTAKEILTLVRRRGWIDSFRSRDNGMSWQSEGKVSDTGGNPPSLLKLDDGRLVLVYGYRKDPFGIRARFILASYLAHS